MNIRKWAQEAKLKRPDHADDWSIPALWPTNHREELHLTCDLKAVNSSLFLFVLDPATVNASSFLEIAHFAAMKAPKLVVAFFGRTEWRDRGHPDDLPDRRKTCDLLDAILTMHDVPVLQSIQVAVCLYRTPISSFYRGIKYIDEVITGEKSWSEALSNRFQRLPYMLLRGRRALQQSAAHVRKAWHTVRSGINRWRGTKHLIIGACEILFVLAMHALMQSLTLVLLVLPLLALDALIGVCPLVYWRYKSLTAVKRRAQLLEQRALACSTPVPVPGRAFVPYDLVAQHTPFSYSCKAVNAKPQTTLIPVQQEGKALTTLDERDSAKICRKHFIHFIKKAIKNAVMAKQIAVFKTRCYESNGVASLLRCMNTGVYDMFLGCSSMKSADLEWITRIAAPQLHKKGISYCSELMIERHKRLSTLDMTRRILYHIPSCKTILSGMVEVAYFLGHTNWSVTLCAPNRTKMLYSSSVYDEEMRRCIERRNECYRVALCYLRNMAERRHCEVFTHLHDALQYVISC